MTAPASATQPEYVLGTDPAELERLGLQHRLWSDAAHSAWMRAGLAPGMNVLDVGCGPGFAAFDMAQIVAAVGPGEAGGPGKVVGVDESAPYLEHLHAQATGRGLRNLSSIQSDVTALASIPTLSPASFDFAYTRWVLCFVKDPAAVVRGVSRLLKPGAKWVIQDYFNYEAMCTAPRVESFAKAVRATGQSWRTRGGDPDIIARLPALLESSGMRVEHLGVTQRLARPGEPMWHWPQSFWRNFLPVLVKMGLLTDADRAQWERDWIELAKKPGAFVLLPAVFDLIAVKN